MVVPGTHRYGVWPYVGVKGDDMDAGDTSMGVPSDSSDLLQSLTAFTVLVDYGRGHTTFLVYPAGQQQPIVRMHKDYPYDVHVRPYYVYPAFGPQQLLGYVKLGQAWDAGQVLVGGTRPNGRRLDFDAAPIVQQGLPETLTAVRQELNGGRRAARTAFRLLDEFAPGFGLGGRGRSVEDAIFSAHIRCTGPTSPGFDLVRNAGPTAVYEVVVHDPRLSGLVVLAYLERFSTWSDGDVRAAAVTATTNPFRNLTENRRMRREKQQREGS
jgi:hypothetical protein